MVNYLSKFNKINFSYNYLYLVLSFLVYGFYSSATGLNFFNKYLYIVLPLIILIIFFRKKEITSEQYFNFITLNNRNWIILILLFLILTFLSSSRIFLSIADDELAYSTLALSHSRLLIEKVFTNIELLQNFNVSFIISITSLIICSLLILFFFILFKFTKNNYYFSIFFIFTCIILLRYISIYFGGNNFPHPPFVGFTPLIFTSLFGLSDFSLKLSSFIFYTFLAYYFFSKINQKTNIFFSFIITLGFFSSPGLLYLGSSVEQSFWTVVCFTIIQIEILSNKKLDYNKLIFIIIFFSFFRILCLVSMVLLFLNVIFYSKNLKDFYQKTIELIKCSLPLIILFPFIFLTFVDHSSVTVDRTGLSIENFQELLFLIPLKLFNSFQLLIMLIILIFLVASFFINKKSIMVSIFLIVLLIVYSSVIYNQPSNPKYIYEIFFPFALSLSYLIIANIDKTIVSKIFFIFSLILFFNNVNFIKNFNINCIDKEELLNDKYVYDVKSKCDIFDAKPIDMKSSFKFLRNYENFSFDNLYVPGVYYGILPSIINDLKIKEIVKHKQINKNQNFLNLKNKINWISADANLINNDKNINFVLLSSVEDKNKIKNELLKLNWKIIYQNQNQNFMTKSIILERVDN